MSEKSTTVGSGIIDTGKIYDTHKKIYDLVQRYKSLDKEVTNLTRKLEDTWEGVGEEEYETQYKLIISKIGDFGNSLTDIYNALVEAEAEYESQDYSIRQVYVGAMEG